MAAATAAAAAVSSSRPYPLLQPTSNTTFVSFPRRPLPATSLALSAPSQLSLRGLPLAPSANPKYHNAKVDVGDEDVSGEELLRRFNWQVSPAGVMEEVRRRRRHDDARDMRKRKARSASQRYRRRRFKGPYPLNDNQGLKEQASDDDENDNWELPAGELPSYR
ncbi:small ribosomal subunit protein bS21c-like [Miscanthus floridulus]|uniref:small ribosomal subunit protein bS21c-like n=1 Tax=Miscanthus floridulus TaxID=154761 RepID=UPI003459B3A1